MEQLKGCLHAHSENSIKDSASKVEEIAKRAKELGYEAVALTDHGNITGWQSFVKACRKEGIKPIPGVEAYVVEDVSRLSPVAAESAEDILIERSPERLHMIFLGLDKEGREAISLLVTEGNEHLVQSQDKKCSYPCVDFSIIEKYMGEGGIGHGHVVATSACDGGILSGLSIRNDAYVEELSWLEPEIARQEQLRPLLKGYLDEQKGLMEEKKAALRVSKKTYEARQENVDNMKDPEKRAAAQAKLDAEKEETQKAKKTIERVTKRLKRLKDIIAGTKKEILPDAKLADMKTRAHYLRRDAKDENSLIAAMEEKALWCEEIFGKGFFYIEIENHGSEREKKWMPILHGIAERTGIPEIAANNEHMVLKEDAIKREYLVPMKLKSFQYFPVPDDYMERYFKGSDELFSAICEVIPKEAAEKAFQNVNNIVSRADACKNFISDEKHYPKFNAAWSKEETQEALEKKARAGIPERYSEWTPQLEERLTYELSVIDGMGFEDYFLIVSWYMEVGRKLGTMPVYKFNELAGNLGQMSLDEALSFIDANQGGVGYSAGPGRGSGAGSIVCYLTGVTSIDPIKYSLVFERFLNPERVSMPDIDADFSKQIRDVLIGIVRKKYGTDGVASIMTRGTLGAKYAIQNCAKVYGSKTQEDAKAYLSLADALSDLVPKMKGSVEDAEKAASVKFPGNEDAAEILAAAKALEGTYIQVGRHAAGVVISDNGDIRRYTALLWDPEAKSWKTQMDKDEVEENHLLKMDFLGLKNLDIISETLRLAKARHPEMRADMNRLPIEPEILKMFADADTDSVFQFESAGMKKMLKDFGPNKFEDLILLVAAYRPGPMQFLPDVIKVKKGASPKYLTPELEPILKDTYGQIIYQEQVMQIFQQLAGYSLGGADLVRRAMGHKEAEKLQRERKAFIYGDPERGIKGCKANGISVKAADTLFSQMEKFAEYAFNKSHAAAYAWISYITAWLKFHYATEFFAAVIRVTGNADERKGVKKIAGIVRDCRAHGVEVVCPDINISDADPVIFENRIYLGFNSVKNVAAASEKIVKARKEGGNFQGITDFLARTNAQKSVFVSLGDADAFRSMCSREVIAAGADSILESLKTLDKLQGDIAVKKELLELLRAGKDDEARAKNAGKLPKEKILLRRLADLEWQMDEAKKELDSGLNFRPGAEDKNAALQREKEALGTYLTGSPLDGFIPIAKEGDRPLQNFSEAKDVSILLFPDALDPMVSKKTGKPYLVFTAVTPLGEIRAMCFNAEVIELLKAADRPVIASCEIRADRRKAEESEEEEDPEFTLFVNGCADAAKRRPSLRAAIPAGNVPYLSQTAAEEPEAFRCFEVTEISEPGSDIIMLLSDSVPIGMGAVRKLQSSGVRFVRI